MSKEVTPEQFALYMQDLCRNEAGFLFLSELYKITGYSIERMVALDDRGNVDPYKTMYNDGQRNIWVQVRRWLPNEYRSLIEDTPDLLQAIADQKQEDDQEQLKGI